MGKESGPVVSQADGVIFGVLYAAKYATEQQLIRAGLFYYEERCAIRRLQKLVKAGFLECFRITMPPGAELAVNPYHVSLVGGSLGGRPSLKAPGVSGDRDQITRVYFLGPLGEEWVRQLIPHYRPAHHPPRPYARDNWSHELSVTRLLVSMLEGNHADRLEQLSRWRWHTPYRGTNLTLSPKRSIDLKRLTPDAVIGFEGRGRTIFLEMDRGTKPLRSQIKTREAANSVAANLRAYEAYFSKTLEQFRANPDDSALIIPQLVYVVPAPKRQQEVYELVTRFSSLKELIPPQVLTIPQAELFLYEWAYGKPYANKETPQRSLTRTKGPKQALREVLEYLEQQQINLPAQLEQVKALI
jgi:hypothetical protein